MRKKLQNGQVRCTARAAAVLVLLFSGFRLLAASGPSEREKADSLQVLGRYLESAGNSRGDARTALTFEIEASLPRLRKHGIMRGLKLVLGAGKVAFTQLQFVGDNLIKTAVIARFLAVQAKEPAGAEDLSITERNYRFHYQGGSEYDGRAALVFRVKPKGRRVGLFRGELWLDEKTAQPLRESGQFVKSPSMFLSKIHFVRDYVLDGGDARLRRITVKLRVAFGGPAELTMWLGEPYHPSPFTPCGDEKIDPGFARRIVKSARGS